MARTIPELAIPNLNFRLATENAFTGNGPTYAAYLQWNLGYEPGTLRPEARTLPLGHDRPAIFLWTKAQKV
ncbi:hypothetical protein AVEN_247516-1, partial [Araneus ventricosus]